MTDMPQGLERSLREGPPDEGGYRAEALNFSTEGHVVSRRGVRAGRSSVPRRGQSVRAIPVLASLDSLALLTAAVVVAFVLLRGAVPIGPGGSRQPTQGATASPIVVPLLTESFVSTRNGFSVRYPEGWSTTAATASWLPNTLLPISSPVLDELERVGVARLVVASQRLGTGQTEAAWLASYGQDFFLQRCGGDRGTWPRISVDGRSGYLDLNGCPFPADHEIAIPDATFGVIVFAGGRVYRIALDGAVDLGYFKAILETVRLDPESAIDPPETP